MQAPLMNDTATPLWTPSQDSITASHLYAFKTRIENDHNIALPDYQAVHKWSVENREEFWSRFWVVMPVLLGKG